MQIQIENTLDVEIVERQFAELWQQAADDPVALVAVDNMGFGYKDDGCGARRYWP